MSPPVKVYIFGTLDHVRVDFECPLYARDRVRLTLSELGLVLAEEGVLYEALGNAARSFWEEGIGQIPDTWEIYTSEVS